MSELPSICVMAEYGSSGIWRKHPTHPTGVAEMLSYEALGVPEELESKFRDWIEWSMEGIEAQVRPFLAAGEAERRGLPEPTLRSGDGIAFYEAGLALAKELKVLLGSEAKVYYGAPDDGGWVEVDSGTG